MELDKQTILTQSPDAVFTDLDSGFTIHVELSKYTLTPKTMGALKADKIFEAVNGDPYMSIYYD